MNAEFKQAVDARDLGSVRMMLSNELILDPRGKTFHEMLAYAQRNLPDLFEPEEPSRFSIPTDKSKWNTSIRSQLKRALNMNFSVEKLQLYETMALHLGADKAAELDRKEQQRSTASTDGADTSMGYGSSASLRQPRRPIPNKTAKIVTGSGVVIGITGLFVEGTLGSILTIAGGIAVIGGIVAHVVVKK